MSRLDLRGCFGTRHNQFLAKARYHVLKQGTAITTTDLPFAEARQFKTDAELADGLEPGDRHSPYTLELTNREAAYQHAGIK